MSTRRWAIRTKIRHIFPPLTSSHLEIISDGRSEHSTMWRKEGYHEDYTKSPVLPDDRDDITEYVELLAMMDLPGARERESK